jgi:NitT/TauT family transport system substrate-binding protein
MALIAADKAAAAESYIRIESSKIDPALLRRILDDPEIVFTTTPRQTDRYAGFMHEIGAINTEPASWRDYFFPEAHALEGS